MFTLGWRWVGDMGDEGNWIVELPTCFALVGVEIDSVDATLVILERESENLEALFDQSDCIPAPSELSAAFVSAAACDTLTGRVGDSALATESRESGRDMLMPGFVRSGEDMERSASDFVISIGVP
jgi:hypothetical protein